MNNINYPILYAIFTTLILTWVVARGFYINRLKNERLHKQDNIVDCLLESKDFRSTVNSIIQEAKSYGLETEDQQQRRATDNLFIQFHTKLDDINAEELLKQCRAVVVRYWDYKF